MRHLIAIIIVCVWTCQVSAQILKLKDEQSADPIPYASISSPDLKAFTSTNEAGEADISAFYGADTIIIQYIGYTTLETSYAELSQQNFLVQLRPSPFSMDQVVISATRWNQRKSDVPARISTIQRATVQLQDPQTAADLLASSGEVFIQKSQLGGGSPMIRGFSANRLLYTVDGVRMNTAIFRGGNLHNVISLDPLAVENTEVFFGPGSIIYGSDAIGAVMAFQTLSPEFAKDQKRLVKGSSKARFSTANQELTGHLDFNIGGERLSFLTSISGSTFSDLRMGKFGPDEYLRPFHAVRQNGEDVIFPIADSRLQVPTEYSQFNLMQKVRYMIHPNWDLQYGFHYSATTDIPRYDRLIRLRDGLPQHTEWSYGPQVWQMNHLKLHHKSGSSLFDEMNLSIAHQVFEESRYDRAFERSIRSIQEEKVNAYSANLDFVKNSSQSTRFFYGLEAIYNQVSSQGSEEDIDAAPGVLMSGPARYPDANWYSLAAYASIENRITTSLLLQAGLRYNYFSLDADFSNNQAFIPLPFTETQINNGALIANLGLVYQLPQQWDVHLNLSSGFRAPNVDDIGKVFDSEPGAVVVPNNNLAAEYAYNAELGLTKKFGEHVYVDVSAYYTLLDNALIRRNFQLNGLDSILFKGELSQIQAIQNAAQAYVFGWQMGLEWMIHPHLRFSTHFNWQTGEEETDEGLTSPSRHVAPYFGDVRLHYRYKGWQLEAYAQYSGEISHAALPIGERNKGHLYAIDGNGNPYAPAWMTLNLKSSIPVRKQMTLNLSLENITNQLYRTYSSGIAAPGRNFIVSLGVDF